MSEDKSIKLFKAAKELNIGTGTIVSFLGGKGYKVENKPTTKLEPDMYEALLKEFQGDKNIKEEAKQISIGKIRKEEAVHVAERPAAFSGKDKDIEHHEVLIKNSTNYPDTARPAAHNQGTKDDSSLPGVKVVGKINLDDLNGKGRQEKEVVKEAPKADVKPVETIKPVEVKPEMVKPEAAKPVATVEPVQQKQPEPAATTTPPAPVQKTQETEKEVIKEAPRTEVPQQAPAQIPVAAKAPEAKAPEIVAVQPIPTPVVASAPAEEAVPESEVIRARADRLTGPNVIGRMTLPVTPPKRKDQPVASSNVGNNSTADQKRKRKRKENGPGQPPHTGQAPNNQGSHPQGNAGSHAPGQNQRPPASGAGNRPPFNRNTNNNNRPDNRNAHGNNRPAPSSGPKEEPTEKEIQDQIKATLARLSGAGKSGKFAQRAKLRRQKRDDYASSAEDAAMEQQLQSKVLKVTEFVTANELASMMDVSVTQIISTCMSLGLFVSINQRLDAETLTIVADEFGYEVEFVKPQDEEGSLDEADAADTLVPRAPIVTIMGHVDHGKTSLLDFIRKTNVIAGEAGGITQHIGAYEVTLENKKKITFLDTPGHEAFTAMRARGAQVTDIVIIVIAADDSIMPQTREAINHAQAAGAPIIFAFNKIDRPGANANKIREQLAGMNILVEDWGGKYQAQEISAKTGLNIDLLLEKILLEAELLELTANPNKRAVGTVIEAALDKGRGIVTTVLVQSGKLRVGDPILAGCYSGRVKALTNERGQRVEEAGPSTPVQVLGMQGAPTAGDKFNAMESEVEAREIANKRLQLQREQGLRTQKHITLDEIGRRLAIGNFRELNIIVKGDVDGSIEALSDSLLKLSTEQIQVNIIGKAVGQISESDVLLASASDAIIIGFQVRPSGSARKLAEQEQIDIRLYSIIYDAINEIKAAMEGMLAPTFEEKIVANVEIRETFKISKVGTIAGCMVLDGKISRNSKIRIVRDGVVIYTGELASLKRYKDDVKEVATGYECGLNINNFNNIEVGDIVEAYENVEVKRKLA
ncbi:translation initiation factor IF-2 [Mucilaginibacter arboris]|uniref:Translation initiation factor IF-2 n=1 Tax=Mucilaginibacter arboris TaxID=2682090 RepID=A0A7K1SVE2_9SPHI|nr:translation initiation factor IF-2 [Mucilaginibacter arboris]MVN21296.1 translation initiation factor IF-2 [Mucilaginibacter arboris]